MHFNSVFISCFLSASAVLANARQPQQLNLPERSSGPLVMDNDDWGGAIQKLDTGTFRYVHGIFTVPNMTSVDGLDNCFVNILVVIDGYYDDDYDSCPGGAVLGLGLNVHAQGNGSNDIEAIIITSTSPTQPPETLDIPISVGHSIQLEIFMLNVTTGHVMIDNLTANRTVDKVVQLSSPLCGRSAAWIISDAIAPATLANFGTVFFTGASAGTQDGSFYRPYGATLLRNLGQDGSDSPVRPTMSSTIAFDDGSLWITYLHYGQ